MNTIADSLDSLLARLATPRVVWLMLPAGEPTEHTLSLLAERLAAGDVVVDGGNAWYRDSQRRAVNWRSGAFGSWTPAFRAVCGD